MAFETLLDHQCDIYHMVKGEESKGYGISTIKYSYPDEADEKNVMCHFNVSGDGNMTQTTLSNSYSYVGKLQLPIDTDIRLLDKIVDCDNGLIYTAEIVRKIRNHHIVVTIHRKGTPQEAL